MRRRALLSLCGVAIAGCVGDDPTDQQGVDPTSTDSTSTALSTDDPTETTTPGEPITETERPPVVGVPQEESDCPGGRRIARIVCVPETDPESVPIAMTADAYEGSLPAEFTFTLDNGTETLLNINFYQWRVWKRVDGEWFHVAPQGWPEPLHQLPPGESHAWSLACEHDLPSNAYPMGVEGENGATVGGLGGGEYAFTTQGWFEGATHENQTGFAVRFSLDGPAVELGPTDAVTGSSRDGDTVTVRGENPNADEDTKVAAFVVSRVTDDDADARTVIPEQAARDYRLRNTLPYFESGVAEVRYVQRDSTVPPFGVNDPYTIRYEGESYRVSSEVVESEN